MLSKLSTYSVANLLALLNKLLLVLSLSVLGLFLDYDYFYYYFFKYYVVSSII